MLSLRTLFRAREGSVIPIVALSMVAMMGATGTAVDMGRAYMAQSRLSNALDAAGLAAGATANTTNISAEVTKYMNANFPSGTMGATITSTTASLSTDKTKVTLAAEGTIDATLLKVLGINKIKIAAASEVTRQNQGMELVLVLDVTLSMNCSTSAAVGTICNTEQTNSKIGALRTAATSLVNILYGTKTTVDNLWIGIVPFSQAVNIGTGRDAWTNAQSGWGNDTWSGCVEARWSGGNDITEVPPTGANKFNKYFNPCSTSNNAWSGTNTSKNNCGTGSGFGYRSSPSDTTHGPNLGCPPALLPMTSIKTAILNRISTLTTIGGTEIPLGMAWGLRMLSPDWRYLWGGEMDDKKLPLKYKADLMNKVVILMTDGNNDIAPGYYSAYGIPNATHSGLGSNACSGGSNCTNGETLLNTKTTAICDAMTHEDRDIIVYTVAFGSGFNAGSLTMLENCASKKEYYFKSPTNTDLQTAFTQIADSLANLRISK